MNDTGCVLAWALTVDAALLKDFIIPLVAPTVALLSAYLFFYLIPRKHHARILALDMFRTYMGEEMRQARHQVWHFFITEKSPEERSARLKKFVRYASMVEEDRDSGADVLQIFQKTSHVMEFFAALEECLQNKTVDRRLVAKTLIYYYVWWHRYFRVHLLQAMNETEMGGMHEYLVWRQTFKQLDKLGRTHK